MKKFAYFLILLSAVACEKQKGNELLPGGLTHGFSPTFILGYAPAECYCIRHSDYKWLEINIEYPYDLIFTPVFHGGTPSEEELQEFARLSERNGDTSYNQETVYHPGHNECFADNFRHVQVVCTNRDIDAAHPAGTPLNDLLIACITTYGPYVRSGYQGKEWRVIEKPLPELTLADMEMILTGSGFEFRFASPSGLSGSYDLQATITTTDGEEKLATGTVEFPYTPSV